MLISYAWLAELSGVDADPAEVARRLTARGLTVDAVTEAAGESVFDVDVPANRPDALGHLGVAREVAAAFGRHLPSRGPRPAAAGAGAVSVAIDAPDLCHRYTAGIVRGVRVGPSPGWVVKRLEACGLRPINNVVDASNLVMLELGQPVHFFDLASVAGAAIRVRRAEPGESLTTLDGALRRLDPEMLVIADARRGVALAGVIGGAETEITDATQDVLVEAAWFLPASVRRTARALGVVTDASSRFERGCDPEAPIAAQARAAALLREIAGGVPEPAVIDAHPTPRAPRRLAVRLARAERLLGYAPAPAEARAALDLLELDPRASEGGFEVTVPSWRVDLEREEDVVEEIGRHIGYDRIPSRMPEAARRRAVSADSSLEERARDRLAALGFSEAFSYAMVPPGDDAPFVEPEAPAALTLANPLAETLAHLRRAIAPGLLRSADQNLRRGVDDVRLFEIGHVFLARGPGELPDEPVRAAFAWSGAVRPRHWSEPARAVDLYDAAGVVEDLLALAGAAPALVKRPSAPAGLHPGRSCSWQDDAGRSVAWCGSIHPDLSARWDVSADVLLGEIDLRTAERAAPGYRAVPRVPGLFRDLSIVLDRGAAAGSVIAALSAIASPAPAAFEWIDRYEGAPLAPGQAAMTLRVILRPQDRTLTDAEGEAYRARLVAALDDVPGARLRRIDT